MHWSQAITNLQETIGNPAFWVGFVLVVFFAANRFAVSASTQDEFDPPVVPRSFTTRFRYYLSAATYVAFYEFAYLVLVSIGSFPFLQKLLEDWITTLGEAKNQEIGTPAWAALVVTTILPPTYGFRDLDEKIRDILQKFASIPHKARRLAEEIVAELSMPAAQAGPVAGGDALDEPRRKARQLDWFYRSIDILQDSTKNEHNADAYKKFFKKYAGVLGYARRRRETLESSLHSSEAKAPFVIGELKNTVEYTARFLSCALLHIESSERSVRMTVRETLGLESLSKLEFDFNLKQIILTFFVLLTLTIVIGIATLDAALPENTRMSLAMIGFVVGWVPYSLVMLVPAFMFAAGVQLYFMDRKQGKTRPIPLEDQMLAVIWLFVLTFGIGILPVVLGMAWKQHAGQPWVMQVLPFGLTPALVAVTFYFLASRHFVQSKWWEPALDFGVFAIVAGISTWFATFAAIGMQLDIGKMSGLSDINNDIALRVFPITSAVLIGLVGGLQCKLSRRMVAHPDKEG